MEYCDWEMKNHEVSGFLDEVFPRKVIITIFE
jgi:hypothetical protein